MEEVFLAMIFFKCLAITINLNNTLNIINNSSFLNCSSLNKGGIIFE